LCNVSMDGHQKINFQFYSIPFLQNEYATFLFEPCSELIWEN